MIEDGAAGEFVVPAENEPEFVGNGVVEAPDSDKSNWGSITPSKGGVVRSY